MDFIRTLHGELRWIIVLVAIVVIAKFAYGWLSRKDYVSLDRSLLMGFTSLMDINLLLGLILLFTYGLSGMHRIEHATTMIIATVVAHLTVLWRKSTDSPTKYRNQLLMVILSLVLVFIGVIRLRSFLGQGGFF